MAFDKPTRNLLAKFVAAARDLIADEFTQQFQSLYGISSEGMITSIEQLGHLDDVGLSIARLLRERIDYLVKTHPDDKGGLRSAVERLAREQAFTVLNRLAAIRMAEKRELIHESVGKGYQSKGFKVFEQVAGAGLGDIYNRYRRHLFCLFDELAIDLGILFDRSSPQGLLFPRETALQELFELINAHDLEELWGEDETIGWVYQYYNDPEERKQMRKESAAPRNSRELAVRNQFFTPRYVVEFLTDNTLGRIWYEMTQGKTQLVENCSYMVRRPNEIFLKEGEDAPETLEHEGLRQDELLNLPVYLPHRQSKDPREIRLLDPACGSMHFGLYAFDLYEVIYAEAWDQGMESLLLDFPDKDTFLREIPRLIIEHNIHGIDIDPRAAQIAGLSLWLRAQKAWKTSGIKPVERPRVLRSNIVCAEPMPGSKEMLREFTETLDPPLLGQLVETVFDKMNLTGEAGALLKIEEEIRSAVEDARRLWSEIHSQPRQLFSTEEMNNTLNLGEKQENPGLEIAISQLSRSGHVVESLFFDEIEERIYSALQQYAETSDDEGYRRRLFAEDAAHGFAFIDLFRKKYDAVVMNPPFGEPSKGFKALAGEIYPKSKNDIYTIFIERSLELLYSHGLLGAITSRTGFFLSSFQSSREDLLRSYQIDLFADLGQGVLDALVKTSAFVVQKRPPAGPGYYWYLLNLNDKSSALFPSERREFFVRNQNSFKKIPGSPLAYWTPDSFREIPSKYPQLEKDGREVRQGLASSDDFRFLRTYWEVSSTDIGIEERWVAFAKGGESSAFHGDVHLLVDWKKNGASIKQYAADRWGSSSRTIKSVDRYFEPGITYTSYTVLGFRPRALPAGCAFSVAGMHIWLPHENLWYCLGFLNSSFVNYFLSLITDGRKFEAGYVKKIPFQPASKNEDVAMEISRIAKNIHKLTCLDDVTEETSRVFLYPKKLHDTSQKINEARVRLNELVWTIFGFDGEPEFMAMGESQESPEGKVKNKAVINYENTYFKQIFSWLIGAVLGRWDVRYATGDTQPPDLADPFDQLPACSPGMLQNDIGLPAEPRDMPNDYPISISWSGITVDEENHAEDIVARIRAVIKVVWKDKAEEFEQESCDNLGVNNLREYIRRSTSFFADHLSCYSKSRRKAPIYLPLSTPSGSYTIWLYYHRLNGQTLHTVLADFIDPKLKNIRSEISAIRATGKQRTRLEELRDLEAEIIDMRNEIEGVIKLPWQPNLNDGVLITASPLWQLFRLPKWQKDLKVCWKKLEKGEFDWAHLAYSIWPERVEKVCENDRSIAIAHGLEHLCKVQPPKPKGKKKKKAATETFEGSGF